MSVDEGVLAGVVIGVCIGALLIAAIIVIVLHVCIYRPRKKRFKKGHVTGNGTAIVYSKPQPIEVVSSHDNIFEVPPPKHAGSVYSLQNGSLHGGGGGSVILQPAYKAPTTMSYDTTDRVFLTMPTRGPRKKKTKAKRVISDEMWNSSVKNLFRGRTRSDGTDGTMRPVEVQYPASVRSRAASEYGGGSMYGSQPSLLTIHRAKPVKTKDKKTVYVVDNTTAASRSVVMAPTGRNSPPLSPTRSLGRSYIAAPPRQRQSHNTSFDLVDYTNTHLFDSGSMARGSTSRGYVVRRGSQGSHGGQYVVSATRSPPHSPNRTDETSMKELQVKTSEDVHLVWTEDMRNRLETRDRQRLESDVSSMASLPRRKQRAPGEHLYKYDPNSQKLTAL